MRYLRTLSDVVERHGERTFLIDARNGTSLTYREAHEAAVAIAAELRRRGLRQGDRLGLALPNSVELSLLYLAALYAGIVVVPIGAGFGRRELRSILTRSRPALVLTSGPAPDERVAAAARDLELRMLTIGAAGAAGELDLWSVPEEDGGWAPFDGVCSQDVVSVHFTSGTTGPPRGVGHRLGDFVANAERYAAATGLDAGHRFYATLPMTYMAGYYNLLLLPFTIGASVVLAPAFDARSLLSFWDAPIAHEADTLWLVPTIMAMLLKADRDPRGLEYCREHVRFAAVGTAPLDPELRTRFEEAYGVPVHESYGLSETLLATSSTPARPAARGSVGEPLPGVEVQIRSARGEVLEPGTPGTIYVSTPGMMAGYLEDVANGDALRFRCPLTDGLLDTGDIGLLDADGELRITGRAKEVIIRGGVNVNPTEVERALAGHPAVERLAVVGVPHELLGEEIAAVLVCVNGHALDEVEGELRSRARSELEPAQQPGLFLQIDELPSTPTGKVRKGALRDLVIDRLGLPAAAKRFTLDPEDEPSAASVPLWDGRTRIVDLSHELREGMTTFPGPNHPRTEVTVLARHQIEGRSTRRLVLGTHTGTHVDAPLHFLPDGATVDTLALEHLVGLAHVVDLTPAEPLAEIGADRLRAAAGGRLHHPRVLLRYDWSRRFGSLDFYTQSPFLSRAACEWLLEQHVALVGMDTPSPDDPRLGEGSLDDSPNHKLLLGAGVVLLEYLNNLCALRRDEVLLAALPLLVKGADGSPARVVALEAAS